MDDAAALHQLNKKDAEVDPRFLHKFGLYVHSAPHPSMEWTKTGLSHDEPFTCLFCSLIHGKVKVTLSLKAPIQKQNQYTWPSEFGQFGSLSCVLGYALRTRHMNVANLIPINTRAFKLKYGVTGPIVMPPDPCRLDIFSTSRQSISSEAFCKGLTYPKHAPDPSIHHIQMEEVFEVVQLLTWPGARKETISEKEVKIAPISVVEKSKDEPKGDEPKGQEPKGQDPDDSSNHTLDQFYSYGEDDVTTKTNEAELVTEEETSSPFVF